MIPASQLLSNDTAGPANESGQTLTLIAVGNAVNGAVSLSGGTITFTPAAQFTGTASFSYTIQDNGTTNGQPDPQSATGTVTVNVAPAVAAATSTVISAAPNPSVFGEFVTFTATVTSGSPGVVPTGTVAFMASFPNGTSVTLGTGTLDATGTAYFSMDQLVPATHTIYAVYLGDANNATSTSASISQVVNPADTVISLSSANQTIVSGGANTLSESLSAVAPGAAIVPFTGTITIYDDFEGSTTVLGVFTIGQSGSFPALTAVGTHMLTAVYSGDSNYNGSTSLPVTIVITPAE
jgi:hypothetical protein